MKTILIFSWFYLPLIGGSELFIKAITDRLRGRYRFIIVTSKMDRRLSSLDEYDNVVIHRVGMGTRMDKHLYPLFATPRSLMLQDIDLIHAVMVNAAAVSAWLRLRFGALPSLLTLQEGDSEDYVQRYLGPLFPIYPRLHRPFDRIHAISSFLKDQAIRYGATESSIRIIPNGIETGLFRQGTPNETLRHKLDLEGKKVLISVSRLAEKNGIDTLVEAMPAIRKRQPHALLLLVGDGQQRQALESRVKVLGLKDVVRFVGAVSHDQIPSYLQLADVFVRPSRSEGLGTALLEAMACGLPVIATPVGGIPDFIKDGRTGLFCQLEDAESVAQAAVRLFDDNTLRNQISTSGLSLVTEHYEWDDVAEAIAQMYEELLTNH